MLYLAKTTRAVLRVFFFQATISACSYVGVVYPITLRCVRTGTIDPLLGTERTL